MEAAIKIENLHKSFGKEEILHGINREFEAGRIHGIVGNNGSGKTVMMKCICGFLRPDEGCVLINGKEVGKDMDFPDDMGIMGYRTKRVDGLIPFNKRSVIIM